MVRTKGAVQVEGKHMMWETCVKVERVETSEKGECPQNLETRKNDAT